MSTGDGKPEIHPPVESGTSQNKATAEKLLSETTEVKLAAASTSVHSSLTASSFGMVSLSNNNLLDSNTPIQCEAIKTGNHVSDFVVNFTDGSVRNLANIGDQTIRSIKDPLSAFKDIGTAGKTIIDRPSIVKDMSSEFGSSLVGLKRAGEAGSSWGNACTTVGILFVGGKGAAQRSETDAVEGASSIEAKVAQTNRLLSSAESSGVKIGTGITTKLETNGEGSEIGPGQLESRVDGLVAKAPAQSGSKPGDAEINSTIVKPDTFKISPLLEIKPANIEIKPVTAELKPATEPVKPSEDPAVKTTEPVKPSEDPAVKTTEPVKPSEDPVKTTERVKPIADPSIKLKETTLEKAEDRPLKMKEPEVKTAENPGREPAATETPSVRPAPVKPAEDPETRREASPSEEPTANLNTEPSKQSVRPSTNVSMSGTAEQYPQSKPKKNDEPSAKPNDLINNNPRALTPDPASVKPAEDQRRQKLQANAELQPEAYFKPFLEVDPNSEISPRTDPPFDRQVWLRPSEDTALRNQHSDIPSLRETVKAENPLPRTTEPLKPVNGPPVRIIETAKLTETQAVAPAEPAKLADAPAIKANEPVEPVKLSGIINPTEPVKLADSPAVKSSEVVKLPDTATINPGEPVKLPYSQAIKEPALQVQIAETNHEISHQAKHYSDENLNLKPKDLTETNYRTAISLMAPDSLKPSIELHSIPVQAVHPAIESGRQELIPYASNNVAAPDPRPNPVVTVAGPRIDSTEAFLRAAPSTVSPVERPQIVDLSNQNYNGGQRAEGKTHPGWAKPLDAEKATQIRIVGVPGARATETGSIQSGNLGFFGMGRMSGIAETASSRSGSVIPGILSIRNITAAGISADKNDESGKSEKGIEQDEEPAGTEEKDPGIGLSQMGQASSTTAGQNLPADPQNTSASSSSVQLQAVQLPTVQISGQDPDDSTNPSTQPSHNLSIYGISAQWAYYQTGAAGTNKKPRKTDWLSNRPQVRISANAQLEKTSLPDFSYSKKRIQSIRMAAENSHLPGGAYRPGGSNSVQRGAGHDSASSLKSKYYAFVVVTQVKHVSTAWKGLSENL